MTFNFMSHGMVMGFASVLLPELRKTTDIDESTATWIGKLWDTKLFLLLTKAHLGAHPSLFSLVIPSFRIEHHQKRSIAGSSFEVDKIGKILKLLYCQTHLARERMLL